MRLAILADIHEDVRFLSQAIERCREMRADRFIVLGDVHGDGRRLDEAADLLAGVDAVGVWGNHDLGLCVDPDPTILNRFDAATLRFFGRFKPNLTLHGYFFQHIQPQRDPRSIEDLWRGGSDIPDTVEKAAICFETPHRVALLGHYHRWLHLAPGAPPDWIGERPLSLANPGRHLVVIDAVANGACAVLDTDADLLTPIDLTA